MALIVIPGLAAITLYAISAGFAMRRIREGKPPSTLLFQVLGWLAVLCHAWSLWHQVVGPDSVALGIFPMASTITLCGALLVLASSFYRPLEWVSLLVFPAAIVLLPPAMLLQSGYVPTLFAPGLATHIVLSILAYAFLAIAACQAFLIMLQHRRLKEGELHGLLRLLPPIQVMETTLFELIWAGFVLLTFAIILGFVYVQNLVAQHLAHIAVLTVISWLIFAFLLAGRHFMGWRSVTAGRLTIAGFVILVVAFFGSKVVIGLVS